MAEKVSWIEVLNEETTWRSRPQMLAWLSDAFGRGMNPSESEIEAFELALGSMRGTIDAVHFGEQTDWQWLDEDLGQIKLTIVCPESVPPARLPLPLLHARVEGASDDDLLRSLRQSLLLQFANFVSDMFQNESAPSVARCVGLFRENNNANLSIVRSISDDTELRWRAEIELLEEHELMDAPTVQRCADIFMATPKAKFCSDACRFTTFQMAKQLRDPRYHAAKQKRYRDNSSRAE